MSRAGAAPKNRFFARTDHIDIIKVWMLELRHTEALSLYALPRA
jgi:hypothetical protein